MSRFVVYGVTVEGPRPATFRTPPSTASPGLLIAAGGSEPLGHRFDIDTSASACLDGTRLWFADHVGAGPNTAEHLLFDVAVPIALTMLGQPVLHAASVGLGRDCILLVGPSGAGKSTLVAALSRLGWTVWSDDATRVERSLGELLAHPSYPCIRLHPGSEYLDGERAGPFAEYSEKRRLQLDASEFADGPGSVRGVVFLRGDGRLDLRRTRSASAAAQLAQQVFHPGGPMGPIERLSIAASVVGAVPTYELSYPHVFGAVEDVANRLREALKVSPDTTRPEG